MHIYFFLSFGISIQSEENGKVDKLRQGKKHWLHISISRQPYFSIAETKFITKLLPFLVLLGSDVARAYSSNLKRATVVLIIMTHHKNIILLRWRYMPTLWVRRNRRRIWWWSYNIACQTTLAHDKPTSKVGIKEHTCRFLSCYRCSTRSYTPLSLAKWVPICSAYLVKYKKRKMFLPKLNRKTVSKWREAAAAIVAMLMMTMKW